MLNSFFFSAKAGDIGEAAPDPVAHSRREAGVIAKACLGIGVDAGVQVGFAPRQRLKNEGQHQHHRAKLDAEEPGGQHHVRRTDDLDVEAVGVVPPIVERRRGVGSDRRPGRPVCGVLESDGCDPRLIAVRGRIVLRGREGHDLADVGAALLAREEAGAVEVLADRVLLYVEDGDSALVAVRALGVEPLTSLVRRGTLEDVFLRLTGRRLED